MAFSYKPRSASAIEARVKQQGGDFAGIFVDGVNVYSVKAGDNWVRILPPTWEDAQHYGLDVHVHYGVGPDNGSVICPAKMKSKPCPICEERARLSARGDEEAAKELKPGRRVLMYVIDRKEPSKGAQIWSAPWTVDRDIATICVDRRSGEIYNIDDPDQGFDLTFSKTGEKIATKYTGFVLARKPSAVSDEVLDQIEANPIPDLLVWRSYKEILELFRGAQDDEPAPPTRRKNTDTEEPPFDLPPRRSRAPEPEEEEAPPPRRVRQRAPEPEEEEALPPRRRSVDEYAEEEAPPPRRVRPRAPEPEEEEAPPPSRVRVRQRAPEPEEEEAPPARTSLRDRLAARNK